jgi:hypothetical protein
MKAPDVSETPLHDCVKALRDMAPWCFRESNAQVVLTAADLLEQMYNLNLELEIDRLQRRK